MRSNAVTRTKRLAQGRQGRPATEADRPRRGALRDEPLGWGSVTDSPAGPGRAGALCCVGVNANAGNRRGACRRPAPQGLPPAPPAASRRVLCHHPGDRTPDPKALPPAEARARPQTSPGARFPWRQEARGHLDSSLPRARTCGGWFRRGVLARPWLRWD